MDLKKEELGNIIPTSQHLYTFTNKLDYQKAIEKSEPEGVYNIVSIQSMVLLSPNSIFEFASI